MKKFLSFLALTLVLCLACAGVVALAEGDAAEPAQTADAHEHEFNVVDKPEESKYVKFVSMPSASNATGLLRFICKTAADYETDKSLDQTEFIEYVVYPTEHDFPVDYIEALKLKDTDADRVVSYTAPKCTEDGSITIKCGHEEQAPEKDGALYYGWEGACPETKSYTIPATGHNWGSKQETPQYLNIKPATCTEKGIVQDYCLTCGEKGEQIETDMEDHVPGEWEVLEKATCVKAGTEVQKCVNCGAVLDEREIPVDETAHVFGDWQVESEKPATCTEDGERVEYRLCGVCLNAKEVRSYTVPALGHDEDNKVVKETVPATCTEEGYITYTCPRCGEEIDDWKVTLDKDPDAHPIEYVKLTAEVAPTCTKDGYNEYTCFKCEKSWKETIDKLGHIEKTIKLDGHCAEEEADELPDLTVTYCVREGCKFEEDITVPDGYEALPTDAVKVLSIVEGKVPDHVWTEWTNRNPYVEGSTAAYWIRQCKVCGKHDELIVNNNDNPDETNLDCLKNGHTPGAPVQENVVEATATEQGSYDEVVYCTVCGVELRRETKTILTACEENGHTAGEPVQENVVEATVEAEGSYDEVVYCTVCGEEISRETITVDKLKDGLVWDEDEKCRLYDNGKFASETSGIVEYNGGEFYLTNGVLRTDLEGLVMLPEGPYYLSAGQIHNDVNEVVGYNGGFFKLVNGKVDISFNGLYEYNGGLFVFAGGQLQSQVDELWANPQDGKWYYLSGGQVHTEHSGVVGYNGGFFVVENGVLDTSYNGTIEYDGHTFEVAGGQLAATAID